MKQSQSEKAYGIAKRAHLGQVDKAGEDYIKHPQKVASFVETDEEKAVAYLHDVIEDTELTLEDLNKYDFSKEVLEAVDIITKKRGEDYQSYLNSVKKNKLARAVKLAELRHNSDLTRLIKVTEKDIKRKEKYQKAIDFLNSQRVIVINNLGIYIIRLYTKSGAWKNDYYSHMGGSSLETSQQKNDIHVVIFSNFYSEKSINNKKDKA